MNVTRKQAARSFGRALRTARSAQGLSQEQLAESGDFDRTYPSLLERGLRTPTFYVILQLAHGLHLDPRALFDYALAECRDIGSAAESQAVGALKLAVFDVPCAHKHVSTACESDCSRGELTAAGSKIEMPHPRKEYPP